MHSQSFRVDRGMAGKRLDHFLCEMMPRESRAYLQKLIEAGEVTRRGVALTKPSLKVAYDDVVEVNVPPPTKTAIEPEDIPLSFLYEDADIAVVLKPAGMVVHPAPGHRSGTLVNALLHHLKGRLSGVSGVERPGLVHRIDKDVSGLLLIAKTDEAHRGLQALFKSRKVDKRYLALVWGRLRTNEGRFDGPIARHPTFRRRMAVAPSGWGKPALTVYRVLERLGRAATLLDVDLRTGRSHQIRVHFSHAGHPLVGDNTYGGSAARGATATLRDAVLAFPRIALHAWRLTFRHPTTGRNLSFEAPVPEEFLRLLAAMRREAEPPRKVKEPRKPSGAR